MGDREGSEQGEEEQGQAATEEIQSHPRQEHFQGAMLFADISGFTALSERLRAESGQQGCERLNAIINQFFDQIIGKCLAHGGDVVKFAGDAMFVVFRALDASDQQGIELTAAAIRAAACAVDVMALDGQQVEAGGTTTRTVADVRSGASVHHHLVHGRQKTPAVVSRDEPERLLVPRDGSAAG